MKEAIRCDIACVKPFLPMLISTVVVIYAVWLFAGNSFSAVGASVAMMTMLMSFSLAGYDNQSGWARFRAALPISRRSLIAGRCELYGLHPHLLQARPIGCMVPTALTPWFMPQPPWHYV